MDTTRLYALRVLKNITYIMGEVDPVAASLEQKYIDVWKEEIINLLDEEIFRTENEIKESITLELEKQDGK